MTTPVSLMLATDEDVAVRDGGDFVRICPADQRLAAGSDGVIAPMGWTLTSASIGDFAARGVAPGQMVLLSTSGGGIRAIDDLLAVDSVATTSLVLRRKGQASGVGMPPGGPSGLPSVAFAVLTLGPQIEDASYEMYRRLGVDDAVVGRRTTDLYDSREVNQATVLTVLRRQYFALARRATPDDAFWSKARALENDLDAVLARLVVLWRPVGDTTGAIVEGSTNRFGLHISR